LRKQKTDALREAFVDTIVGTFLNVPINFLLAVAAVHYAWSPLEITFYFTSIFFLIAIYRKYKIRLYFGKTIK
jgi:hypothetical protein